MSLGFRKVEGEVDILEGRQTRKVNIMVMIPFISFSLTLYALCFLVYSRFYSKLCQSFLPSSLSPSIYSTLHHTLLANLIKVPYAMFRSKTPFIVSAHSLTCPALYHHIRFRLALPFRSSNLFLIPLFATLLDGGFASR